MHLVSILTMDIRLDILLCLTVCHRLSVHLKSVRLLPPLDRSERLVTGRRFLEMRLDEGMLDSESIEKKTKSLQKEISHLSGHKSSFSAEREGQ